ncbi:MAG: precorrin-2 C(20)-methyltransferase [Deltaproteobacteria bacterium HGW-Deltaproteobacteria-23]|nr:MAG: precorrin-2 C(20)-methyltransferase [Deltaproteobacteria bacterium HGW-Deltaproteobacteria-23]
MATIYAVGVGPGDPELLTRKAERIISQSPVICAPTGAADAASYALSIVEHLLDRSRQEILTRVFPMMKKGPELEAAWEEVATEVIERIDGGQDVAFITIGDPCLYSTFLYLYRIIRAKRADIPVEIIPGISSINAAAAAAGIPLGIADERIAILPATYENEELKKTLAEFDTIVLMKVNRVFDRIYPLLCELGLDKSSVFIRRVGSSQQEVISDISTLLGRELDYLSMLIVRN